MALFLALSACATIPDITQSRSPCRMEPGGWCDFVRKAAVESYPYAMAATSAYQGDDDIYPDDKLGAALKRVERLEIDEEDLGKGFGYQVFDQYDFMTEAVNGRRPHRAVSRKRIARIIAFRGTDLGFKDLFHGALLKKQGPLAKKYFDLERARPEAAGITRWIVTGHSLGGALATEVSAEYDDVKAWMFNTSPFLMADPMKNDMNRTLINERGDWLRAFRKYDDVPAANMLVLNCSPQAGRVTKHKIRRLSDCITWIAAYENVAAWEVVRENDIEKPAVQCDDATTLGHPGPGHVQRAPCVHRARKPKREE